jgi:hypothetical protein
MDSWYAYGAVDEGEYLLYIFGPIAEGAVRSDSQPWESAFFDEGLSNEPIVVDFITAFDHTPSMSEQMHLIPEEHRERFMRRNFADPELPESDEKYLEAELTDRERISLCIAVETRIEQLSTLMERLVLMGTKHRAALACQEQINALVSMARKLELTQEEWGF